MAKTVLNLLLSFDGFIASEKDEIDWIEKSSSKIFYQYSTSACKLAGYCLMRDLALCED